LNMERRQARLALLGLVTCGVLAACGVAMLLSAVIGEISERESPVALLLPGLGAVAVGAVGLYKIPPPQGRNIDLTTGFAAVTLAWVAASLIGGVPYLIADTFDSPIDALFESMSGFTTTGATLIDNVEAEPDEILLWRSLTQWLGGVGIVLLVVAIAPLAKVGLQRVFYAEVTGITADRLTPRIADTAKIIAGIYVSLSLAALAAYYLAGMGAFDALNHALTTMATGGFSTRTASIGAYDSQAIETVAVIFMVFAGINFAVYWRLVQRREARAQLAEVIAFVAILAGSIVALTVSLEIAADVSSLGRGLRDASFTAVSVMTTTGFTTADFDSWNEFARLALLGLMVVGACAGSTGGGIKVIRAVLLGQAGWQELGRQTQPTRVRVLRLGGRTFPEGVRVAVLGFMLVYVLVFATGSLAFSVCGLEPTSSVSATAATLNNIGPGLGDVGAVENFTGLPAGGRLVATFLMLVGRLEIFTVLALIVAGVSALSGVRGLRRR
jgi:trk/ktr system potassium uptake protein